MRSMWQLAVCATLVLAAVPLQARAEVYATVDRSSVQLNESFSLTLTADDGESGEPQVGGLDEHFDILGRSQNSSISIINGERQTSRRWTYVLLPKAAGEFRIPPLTVGGASSEPIAILVREATVAPPGEADVFFEVSLDREQSWVQAQVIYTIKLYLGVAVRQTSLEDPRIEGGEVLLERLAEDRRYEAQIDNRLYTVIERNFAMFPQASGDYKIQSVRFTASLWERGRISSPKVFSSEALELRVDPVVAPPAELAGAAWLPARSIALTASMRPEDGILEAGEPANIRLRLQAEGLMSSQLPELLIDEQSGLRVYPDQPDMQTRALQTTMLSTREQSFAVIAARGGVFTLPELALPWFDVDAGEWRVERLQLAALRAAGVVSGNEPAPSPQAVAAPATPAEVTQPSPVADTAVVSDQSRRDIFRLKVISYGLLALWLITVWLYWRSGRVRAKARRKARREMDAKAPYRATQKAFKALQRACEANDATAARDAMLVWARHFWPERPARSLGDIADRLPTAEAQAVETLNRHLYRGGEGAWDGKALRAALQRMHRAGAKQQTLQQDELPPLFPAS